MSKPPYEKFADDYASSRPGYPSSIKTFLFELFDVGSDSCIADIACGSGIFTQLLSCDGNAGCVIGLDRSLPLLVAGMSYFKEYCFKPLCSRGEMLPLKSQCCDLVTVAQGFHWMNRQQSLAEINRILKPGGGIALVWYRRKTLTEPHQAFIEQLTHKYNPNYDPKFMDADYVGMLLGDGRFTDIGQKRFYSSRIYDLDTYIRWQRSKSFIGDAMEEDMLEEFLEKVSKEINRFFPDGVITEEFKYDLIYGRRM
jgi:ubiquinone/menaquinone biosynthesis C-methylase UbiE